MKNYIAMIVACVFWAGAFIAGKSSIGSFGPWSLTFYRFFFASLILFSILFITAKEDLKLSREQWKAAIILGFVGMTGYHVFFFTALKFTTASSASMLAATNPIMTAILLAIFYKEKLSLPKIGLLLLALFGVALTITNWQLGTLLDMERNVGELIMLVAVLCWAGYSILVKKYIHLFKPIVMTAYAFLTCTLMVLPFALVEGLVKDSLNAPTSAWLSALYMAFFASVLGYWIQQASIQKIGPAKTNIFINLVPVFSLILASVFLGENIPITKLISGGMIIAAVVSFNLLNIRSAKTQ